MLAVPKNGELDLYSAPLQGSRLRVRIDYDGRDPIEALVFDRSLEQLRLTEGTLERPSAGDEAGELDALEPLRSFVAEIDRDSGSAEWVEDSAQAARQARYKKARSVCATFTAPFHAGMLTGALTFALRLDDEHALLGSRAGDLVIASDAGLTPISPPFAGAVESAFTDGAQIYLSERYSPRIYRADPSSVEGAVNLDPLPDSPLAFGASIMAGGEGRLIAAADDGTAAWFDGTAWRSLPAVEPRDRLRVAWTGDEAFYWVRASGALNRVDDAGNVRVETVDSGGGVFSIAHVEGIGTVLGTGDGTFLKREGTSWRGLGGDYGWWGLDLEAYSDGFFFLLASGTVGQYRMDPDQPFCTDQSLLSYINDGQIVLLGRSLVAAGWDANLPTDVVIVGFQ